MGTSFYSFSFLCLLVIITKCWRCRLWLVFEMTETWVQDDSIPLTVGFFVSSSVAIHVSHSFFPHKYFVTLSAGANHFGIPCYNWVNIKANHRPSQHPRHLLNNDRFVLNKVHLCICSYGQGRLSLASALFSFSRWGARVQAAEIAGR